MSTFSFRPRLPLLAAASALVLSACASLPPAEAARVAKAPQAYAADRSLAAPTADWPADAWWTGYGDAQLNALEDEGLKGSPSLAAAQARLRRAQALTAQARSADLPRVGLGAEVGESKQSYNAGIPPAFVPHGYNDVGRVALDVSWELDFFGKNRAAIAAATSEARAAEADAAQARLTLSTAIASTYAELSRLYAQRDVAAQAVRLRQETSDLVAKRVANGLDTKAESEQAAAGPPASKAELSALDEQIALTRNALAALVGAGPDRGLSITRPANVTLKPFGLPQNLPANLIGRRPDVVAARWRAEAATARTRQAKAAFYPDINLAGFVGVQSLYLDKLFSSGSDIGQVGPALRLPIFQGGALRAGLRGAEADRDAAVASYDGALTQALREVADVTASQRALTARLADARAALAANENAYRIARLRYEGQLSTYQSVLLAEQSVLAQRRVVADLESRAFALDIALVRALGGGFTGA
ncbi:efflux transporter outer membrane subunit [uncultured Caulobacter sp.]|uniref:efflux transporter outer membrane subunit n=1 Tax=uncultured Caulobacter sp. TaxID=158749 RepID=UPI00262EAD74|nr:efflux transporter outer membrane subunit [uncultured Caulobacter sp.]